MLRFSTIHKHRLDLALSSPVMNITPTCRKWFNTKDTHGLNSSLLQPCLINFGTKCSQFYSFQQKTVTAEITWVAAHLHLEAHTDLLLIDAHWHIWCPLTGIFSSFILYDLHNCMIKTCRCWTPHRLAVVGVEMLARNHFFHRKMLYHTCDKPPLSTRTTASAASFSGFLHIF